ncbi:MAG TPA: hypothetical protein VGM33_10460 [Baekduia sp.]|jgi:hypothetical protein
MTEITRRSLLRTGATATAAVIVGVRPWDPAAAGAASAVATPLRRSDYAGLVGTDFAVADAPGAAMLRLAWVSDLARPALRGSEDAFSLTFSGDTPLDSGIHGLTHPELGSFDLFVSPVETAERHRYEAVIDRSVVAPSSPPAGPTTTPGTGAGAGDAPTADGSGAAQPSGDAGGPTDGGAAPAGDGSGAAQPAGDGTAPAGDGSGAAQPAGTGGTGGGAATAASRAAKRGASTPSVRRAAFLQRAAVRRLGRGARVEIALRASVHTVHVSLQRGGKSVAEGSHAVHDRHATVALKSAHHLPAGSYVLVVSAVDGTGSTLVQRRRIAVR